MIGRNWNWSDIVNPRLLDEAMAAEKRRARRRAQHDPAEDRERDLRSVTA